MVDSSEKCRFLPRGNSPAYGTAFRRAGTARTFAFPGSARHRNPSPAGSPPGPGQTAGPRGALWHWPTERRKSKALHQPVKLFLRQVKNFSGSSWPMVTTVFYPLICQDESVSFPYQCFDLAAVSSAEKEQNILLVRIEFKVAAYKCSIYALATILISSQPFSSNVYTTITILASYKKESFSLNVLSLMRILFHGLLYSLLT